MGPIKIFQSMVFQQHDSLAKLTKYKHHGANDRDDACCDVSTVTLEAVVQTHSAIRRDGTWRASCGVGDHGQSQTGHEHQHAWRVQQGFASRPVH